MPIILGTIHWWPHKPETVLSRTCAHWSLTSSKTLILGWKNGEFKVTVSYMESQRLAWAIWGLISKTRASKQTEKIMLFIHFNKTMQTIALGVLLFLPWESHLPLSLSVILGKCGPNFLWVLSIACGWILGKPHLSLTKNSQVKPAEEASVRT